MDIIPLYHKALREQGFFNRPWEIQASDGNYRDFIDGRPFSTQFAFTRFLVPSLMKYNGWALFMDCDMIFRTDIKELFEMVDDKYAVMCVKHRQPVNEQKKMDGSIQTKYYRKNWSSFMMFNCGHKLNKELTPEVVNTQTGSWLHGFEWLPDQAIGEIPNDYNWIDGSSPSNIRPKVIHYTLGGPWFAGYQDVKFADEWYKYYKSMLAVDEFPDPSDKLLDVDYKNL